MNRWNAIVLTLVIVAAVVWVNMPTKPAQADMQTASNFSGPYQIVQYESKQTGKTLQAVFNTDTGEMTNYFTEFSTPPKPIRYTIIQNPKGGCFILDTILGTTWQVDAKGQSEVVLVSPLSGQ